MDNTNKFFLPISVIAAGLLIAGAVVWNGSRPPGVGGTAGQEPNADIALIRTENHPFIGKADAPVTIAFWSDFQCPFCKQFETGGVKALDARGVTSALPEIIKQYVDTGKAKVVFMDFAFLGEDSTTAAEYSWAVWKLYPEKYFEWRTAMYLAQDEEQDTGFGDAASIQKLTATIAGIDVPKVVADVQANKAAYSALIEADREQASGVFYLDENTNTVVPIRSTPTILVGKKVIAGAAPFSEFKKAIDPLLK